MVSSKFQNYGNSLTDKAGEMLAEAFVKQGKAEVLKESFGITLKDYLS